MHLLIALTTALAATACASIQLRADDVLSRPYALTATLTRRADASSDTNSSAAVPLNADGTLNEKEWGASVDAACVSTLRSIPQSTNPSGNCVCYNLAALDSTTGIFEADLRLYKISEPRDGFAGIKGQDVNVSAAFNGAEVTSLKEEDANGNPVKMRSLWERATVEGDPELVKIYMIGGQIDKAKMSENMTMATFEALVMPVLSLKAQNSTGSTVSTDVSSNEAAFLTGVFSDTVVMSDFSAAQAAVDKQLAQVNSGDVAFVLPGVQIMVFPVGLIVTGTWLLAGVVVYGFGTFERIKYAESYRRRLAAAGARGWKPI